MTAAVLKLKRPTAKTEGKPLHKQVTFKLDDERLDQLARAGRQDGISHHEKAKRIVEASLDGDVRELDQLRIEVSETRQAYEDLVARFESTEKGLAEVLAVVLHLLEDEKGNRLTHKAAVSFVATAFNQKRPEQNQE